MNILILLLLIISLITLVLVILSFKSKEKYYYQTIINPFDTDPCLDDQLKNIFTFTLRIKTPQDCDPNITDDYGDQLKPCNYDYIKKCYDFSKSMNDNFTQINDPKYKGWVVSNPVDLKTNNEINQTLDQFLTQTFESLDTGFFSKNMFNQEVGPLKIPTDDLKKYYNLIKFGIFDTTKANADYFKQFNKTDYPESIYGLAAKLFRRIAVENTISDELMAKLFTIFIATKFNIEGYSFFGDVGDYISKGFNYVKDGVESAFDFTKDIASTIGNTVADGLKSGFNSAIGGIKDFGYIVKDGVNVGVSVVSDGIRDAAGSAADWAKTAAETVADGVVYAASNVGKGVLKLRDLAHDLGLSDELLSMLFCQTASNALAAEVGGGAQATEIAKNTCQNLIKKIPGYDDGSSNVPSPPTSSPPSPPSPPSSNDPLPNPVDPLSV
jgi:hypothetical protein